MEKHVVPEPCYVAALHLGQVEVWAGVPREQFFRVAEEVEAEIEQAPRHGPAVDEDMLLVEVPAARAAQQGRDLILELVRLPFGACERDVFTDRVRKIDLAV